MKVKFRLISDLARPAEPDISALFGEREVQVTLCVTQSDGADIADCRQSQTRCMKMTNRGRHPHRLLGPGIEPLLPDAPKAASFRKEVQRIRTLVPDRIAIQFRSVGDWHPIFLRNHAPAAITRDEDPPLPGSRNGVERDPSVAALLRIR